MAKKYIDVSTFQGEIDWEKVKGQIEGAIIRAGYGQNNIDAQFKRNISECNRLGIPCGVYWFSYARDAEMAEQEAGYCLEAIKEYRVELPVCFDFEYDSVKKAKAKGVSVDKTLATAIVHAFCGAIEAAGYYAMNYTNKDFLSKYFDETTLRYDLWLAVWPKVADPENPPRSDCGIWQYGGSAIDGIKGGVDNNWVYRDYPKIIAGAGLNHLNEQQAEEKEKPWYAEAQAWAKAKGISDGERPEEAATRAEVWTMLKRLNEMR